MTGRRIHILGASGAGVSTLGRLLANRLDSQCFDTDDFYWEPTDPPFKRRRAPEARLALMEALFLARADWILAGPFVGWGDALVPRLTHVVFLSMAPEARLERLARREIRRLGPRAMPGGDRAAHVQGFLDYAACYDDPSFDGRSRVQQESWLSRLPGRVPVIRLDGSLMPGTLVDLAAAALDAGQAAD